MKNPFIKILEEQLENEEIETWEDLGYVDPEKEKRAVEWFETIPEEAILYGKRLTMSRFNRLPKYPPEYWEDRPEAEFEAYLRKLDKRRQEIKSVCDTRNLLAMFITPVLGRMLSEYPSIEENCPDFMVDGIRRDIYWVMNGYSLCWWDDLVERLLV